MPPAPLPIIPDKVRLSDIIRQRKFAGRKGSDGCSADLILLLNSLPVGMRGLGEHPALLGRCLRQGVPSEQCVIPRSASEVGCQRSDDAEDEADDEGPKSPEMCEDLADVVAVGTEHGEKRVADPALQGASGGTSREGVDPAVLSADTWRDEMRARGISRSQETAAALASRGYHGLISRSFARGNAADHDAADIALWTWPDPPARLRVIDDEGRLAALRYSVIPSVYALRRRRQPAATL